MIGRFGTPGFLSLATPWFLTKFGTLCLLRSSASHGFWSAGSAPHGFWYIMCSSFCLGFIFIAFLDGSDQDESVHMRFIYHFFSRAPTAPEKICSAPHGFVRHHMICSAPHDFVRHPMVFTKFGTPPIVVNPELRHPSHSCKSWASAPLPQFDSCSLKKTWFLPIFAWLSINRYSELLATYPYGNRFHNTIDHHINILDNKSSKKIHHRIKRNKRLTGDCSIFFQNVMLNSPIENS